jgi:hypothetical protein
MMLRLLEICGAVSACVLKVYAKVDTDSSSEHFMRVSGTGRTSKRWKCVARAAQSVCAE